MKLNYNRPIVYQIYPMSFKDSNNDGMGDLKGIISKLDYLQSLNIDFIWLSPIFKTGFSDNGYDVIDYYHVDSHFGTDQDLKDLIKEAKKRDIGVMLDMVFNHTSSESVWFKEWLKGNPKYKDFYISKTSKNGLPNDWVSKFGGTCWKEYKPNTYYLHLFDVHQPDLNWANKKVRDELKNVLKHYINMGIAGFRFDVINLIAKTKYVNDPENLGRWYYTDTPKVSQYLKELLSVCPTNKKFFTVGECSSTTPQKACEYTNQSRKILNSIFFFKHLYVDKNIKVKYGFRKPDWKYFNDIINEWYSYVNTHNGLLANVLNNHDQPRSLSRLIDDKRYYIEGAKLLYALNACLEGVPFIYQGEELGMLNPRWDDIKEYRDVETLNYIRANKLTKADNGVKLMSRDNARTPMQWNDKKYAGFSNTKPWINVEQHYKDINVEKEDKDQNSILNFYREFNKILKTNNILLNGKMKFLPFHNNIISYTRTYHNKSLLIVASLNNKNVSYKYDAKKVVVSNYPANKLKPNTLLPYQFLLIER